MSKVFLYLYPIKDFADQFVHFIDSTDDRLTDYEKLQRHDPFDALNDTIDKRYRKKGYKVIYAIYPDKEVFDLEVKPEDGVIYTDITFHDVVANFEYPNEQYLIAQIGYVDELVVGGYHAMDCVKRVAEKALENGINTLVDLELTDLFFHLHKEKYFNREVYSPERFKQHMITRDGKPYVELNEELFNSNYESPVYGFAKVKLEYRSLAKTD